MPVTLKATKLDTIEVTHPGTSGLPAFKVNHDSEGALRFYNEDSGDCMYVAKKDITKFVQTLISLCDVDE